jgi:GNAT superfamily N-acetyltransferase
MTAAARDLVVCERCEEEPFPLAQAVPCLRCDRYYHPACVEGHPCISNLLGLRPVPIRGYHAVMQLRMIRNACRDGFAHHTAEIGHAEQLAWWTANKDRVVGFLYRDLFGFPVGFGLLRRTDDGRWWSSVAVLPAHAGKGFGGAITRHIVRQSPSGVVYAQARKDQPKAMALHNAADWEVVGEDNRLVHYKTREPLR